MFGSIERSWNLAKESLGVIRKDHEIMIFLIVSFIAGVIATGIPHVKRRAALALLDQQLDRYCRLCDSVSYT
jgi:hypothetical protein